MRKVNKETKTETVGATEMDEKQGCPLWNVLIKEVTSFTCYLLFYVDNADFYLHA